jgi:hypothetical protein
VRRAIFLLRYGTRVFEDLVALLVQEEMIVAEVRARDVPVKVLCLQVLQPRVAGNSICRRETGRTRFLATCLCPCLGVGVEPDHCQNTERDEDREHGELSDEKRGL